MKKKTQEFIPKISGTTFPQESKTPVTCKTGLESLDYDYCCKLVEFVEYEYQQLCDMKQYPNVDISRLGEYTIQDLHNLAEELETMYRTKLGIER